MSGLDKALAHPVREPAEILDRVQPAHDPRLIRDHHQREPALGKDPRPFEHARQEVKVLLPHHVPEVDVDDPVAIRERRPPKIGV
jgi:hypothetical protein